MNSHLDWYFLWYSRKSSGFFSTFWSGERNANTLKVCSHVMEFKVHLHVPSPSPSNFNIVSMEMDCFFTKWVQNPFCKKTVRFHLHNVNNLTVTVTGTVRVNRPLSRYSHRNYLVLENRISLPMSLSPISELKYKEKFRHV